MVGSQGRSPTVTVYTDAGDGVAQAQVLQIPKTRDEMAALMAQRSALSDQLDQLKDQRGDLIDQLRSAPSEARPGLEAQLNVVSNQIVDLQRQVNLMGREIAGSSPDLIAMTRDDSNSGQPGTFEDGVFIGVASSVGSMIFLLLVGRWIWKRFVRDDSPRARTLPSADSERLQRLENGIEAMAIEIERISEGQRFVTKLLSQSKGYESVPR